MDEPTYTEKLKDPRWQRKRLEILNRDKWTCLVCGAKTKTLHVHHAAYEGEPWEVRDDLLYTVCVDCHEAEHRAHRAWLANILLILGRLGVRSSVDIMHLAEATAQNANQLPGGEKGPPYQPSILLQAFHNALHGFEAWRADCGQQWFEE